MMRPTPPAIPSGNGLLMRGLVKRTRWRFWWALHGDGRRRSKKNLLRLARVFSLSLPGASTGAGGLTGRLGVRTRRATRRLLPEQENHPWPTKLNASFSSQEKAGAGGRIRERRSGKLISR